MIVVVVLLLVVLMRGEVVFVITGVTVDILLYVTVLVEVGVVRIEVAVDDPGVVWGCWDSRDGVFVIGTVIVMLGIVFVLFYIFFYILSYFYTL